jgi:pimeloyl-ACP methyl ester carboxylesterase
VADTQSTDDFVVPPLPTLRKARVFGREICYYDVGDGPPLLLVHGVGGDADQWAFCFAGLAASQRVIAVDLLGFGRSDKPLIDYRIAGFVELLDRFLEVIEVRRPSVLGHSLGGWIAASFASRFPEKIDKLILNDSAGVDEGSVPLSVDLNVSTRANMRRVFDNMFHDPSFVTDALVDLAYSLHLERSDGYAIKSVLETLGASSEKLDGKLNLIAAPTLILWGENDVITPFSMGQTFRRGIAHAELCTIARCGHLPCLERPAEFVAAVVNFLHPGADKIKLSALAANRP